MLLRCMRIFLFVRECVLNFLIKWFILAFFFGRVVGCSVGLLFLCDTRLYPCIFEVSKADRDAQLGNQYVFAQLS